MKRFEDFIDKDGKVDIVAVREEVKNQLNSMTNHSKLRWKTIFSAEEWIKDFFFSRVNKKTNQLEEVE